MAPVSLPAALVGSVEVYYSTTSTPCYDSRFKIPVGCPDWSLTPPTPISDTRAILYDFDDAYTIAVDQTVQLELNLVAPVELRSTGRSPGTRSPIRPHAPTPGRSCSRPSLAKWASTSPRHPP